MKTTMLVILACMMVGVAAQGTFEAASIKRNTSESANWGFVTQPGGRLVATNVTARQMVTYAYSMQNSRVEGGPPWTDTERYDIVAKAASATATQTEMLPLLRALLADRFKLSVRIEARETPVFALVLARDDRRLGPQLRPSKADCAAVRAALAQGQAPTLTGDRPLCVGRSRSGLVVAGAITMEEFANNLWRLVDYPVVDRTGLKGRFDLDLRWLPQDQPPGDAGADEPSLFIALQEQLGLKLQSQQALIDMVVIDRVERPSVD